MFVLLCGLIVVLFFVVFAKSKCVEFRSACMLMFVFELLMYLIVLCVFVKVVSVLFSVFCIVVVMLYCFWKLWKCVLLYFKKVR